MILLNNNKHDYKHIILTKSYHLKKNYVYPWHTVNKGRNKN